MCAAPVSPRRCTSPSQRSNAPRSSGGCVSTTVAPRSTCHIHVQPTQQQLHVDIPWYTLGVDLGGWGAATSHDNATHKTHTPHLKRKQPRQRWPRSHHAHHTPTPFAPPVMHLPQCWGWPPPTVAWRVAGHRPRAGVSQRPGCAARWAAACGAGWEVVTDREEGEQVLVVVMWGGLGHRSVHGGGGGWWW